MKRRRRRTTSRLSAVALPGLTSITVGVASGCLAVDPIIDVGVTDSGAVDGGRGDNIDGGGRLPVGDPARPRCRDNTASFQPKDIPLAYPATKACTLAQIQALSGACAIDGTIDPNTDVTCANAKAANTTCAECIFGNKDDAQEKIVTLLPGEQPAARVNTSACLDHATGVPGCGGDFLNVATCFDTFCQLITKGGTCLNDSDVSECVKTVRDSECKEFLIADQTCGEGIQNAKECFPAGPTAAAQRAFFEGAADIACGEKANKAPVKDGGS
jgi:hypothetical protein